MQPRPLKADLHVHSKFSTRPSEWILQKIGCPESFSEPKHIYELARKRGMDLVTITDHNTIAGALEIAHLPGTFVSEEITSYFPEDRCKVHVLAYDISEAQHEDISRIRENVFDLVEYLGREGIAHVLAHPMYGVNDRHTPEHFEELLLLFKNLELNGARDGLQNRILAEIAANLTRPDIERLAERHGIEPRGQRPWEKNLVGGSDDHSSLNVARMHTEVRGADGVAGFLAGVEAGRCRPAGVEASPWTMAHNLYGIAYQFYCSRFRLGRFVNKDPLLRFAENALTSSPAEHSGRLLLRLQGLFAGSRRRPFFKRPRGIQQVLRKEATAIIFSDTRLSGILAKRPARAQELEREWFRFVSLASEKVLKHFADKVIESALGANIFDIFGMLGSSGSLYALLAPYFVAFTLFTKDRRFARLCRARLADAPEHGPGEPFKIAHFTDTFHEINGVARSIKSELRLALEQDLDLRVITCGPENEARGVTNFAPIGAYSLPEYPELTLYYPPFLSMLNHCFEQEFTHIHSATPGPIGLAALGIAKVLKLPIAGTYHTALPQYVAEFTGDAALEEGMWKYMCWYYGQMDVIYVPSKATGQELVDKGIEAKKIRTYPRGVNTERFHPAKRNGFFGRHGLGDGLKFLYVGRISREKDLNVLAAAFRDLARTRPDVHLVVVGDGPYLEEMRRELAGTPTLFTGYLTGEDLAQAYASCDVFVFPSTTDTFGNVVLEAQASGLPVIVSDVGGPQENVLDGETGLIAAGRDAQAFCRAMRRLADDPALLAAMRRAARTYMEGRSFKSAFAETWQIYRESHAGAGT